MSIVRTTIGAFLLGVALAGSAAAAPADPCLFGECAPGARAPAAKVPVAKVDGSEARQIAEHGSWVAIADGDVLLVMDRFEDGTTFGIAFFSDGKSGALVTSPQWRLSKGQTLAMDVTIDGKVYKGNAVALNATDVIVDNLATPFVQAIHDGRRATVAVGPVNVDLTLANAAATIDDAVRVGKTAAE